MVGMMNEGAERDELLIEFMSGLVETEFEKVYEAQRHAQMVFVQSQCRIRNELKLLRDLLSSQEKQQAFVSAAQTAMEAAPAMAEAGPPRTPATAGGKRAKDLQKLVDLQHRQFLEAFFSDAELAEHKRLLERSFPVPLSRAPASVDGVRTPPGTTRSSMSAAGSVRGKKARGPSATSASPWALGSPGRSGKSVRASKKRRIPRATSLLSDQPALVPRPSPAPRPTPAFGGQRIPSESEQAAVVVTRQDRPATEPLRTQDEHSLDNDLTSLDIGASSHSVEIHGPIEQFRDDEARISSLQFCAGGKKIVTTSFGFQPVKVWDAVSGRCLLRLGGHKHAVLSARVLGSKILTGCGDGQVRMWDVNVGNIVRLFDAHGPHGVLSIYVDDSTILTGSLTGPVRMWRPSTFKLQCELPGKHEAVWDLHANDQVIVAGCEDDVVMVWNRRNLQFMQRLVAHKRPVRCVRALSTGILSAGDDGQIILWEIDSQRKSIFVQRVFEPTYYPTRFLEYLGGNTFVSSSADGKLRQWKLSSSECEQVVYNDGSDPLCCDSATGMLLAGLKDGRVLKWIVSIPSSRPPSSLPSSAGFKI